MKNTKSKTWFSNIFGKSKLYKRFSDQKGAIIAQWPQAIWDWLDDHFEELNRSQTVNAKLEKGRK
jgi:hypothetical protein